MIPPKRKTREHSLDSDLDVADSPPAVRKILTKPKTSIASSTSPRIGTRSTSQLVDVPIAGSSSGSSPIITTSSRKRAGSSSSSVVVVPVLKKKKVTRGRVSVSSSRGSAVPSEDDGVMEEGDNEDNEDNEVNEDNAVSTPQPSITAPSLSTFVCPICLGFPTPFAMSSCGHGFCAPCLHVALASGPALTPPPPDFGFGRQYGGGAGGSGGGGGGGAGRGGINVNGSTSEASTELDARCPVCRTVLKGGWGHALRGLTMKMKEKRAS